MRPLEDIFLQHPGNLKLGPDSRKPHLKRSFFPRRFLFLLKSIKRNSSSLLFFFLSLSVHQSEKAAKILTRERTQRIRKLGNAFKMFSPLIITTLLRLKNTALLIFRPKSPRRRCSPEISSSLLSFIALLSHPSVRLPAISFSRAGSISVPVASPAGGIVLHCIV